MGVFCGLLSCLDKGELLKNVSAKTLCLLLRNPRPSYTVELARRVVEHRGIWWTTENDEEDDENDPVAAAFWALLRAPGRSDEGPLTASNLLSLFEEGGKILRALRWAQKFGDRQRFLGEGVDARERDAVLLNLLERATTPTEKTLWTGTFARLLYVPVPDKEARTSTHEQERLLPPDEDHENAVGGKESFFLLSASTSRDPSAAQKLTPAVFRQVLLSCKSPDPNWAPAIKSLHALLHGKAGASLISSLFAAHRNIFVVSDEQVQVGTGVHENDKIASEVLAGVVGVRSAPVELKRLVLRSAVVVSESAGITPVALLAFVDSALRTLEPDEILIQMADHPGFRDTLLQRRGRC